MGKKLAIIGHSTRGNEVIELLEMLGGKNIHKHNGEANAYSYYISGHAILSDRLSIIEDDDFVIFTIQEFLEKYPYKVGDKVVYTKYGYNCDDCPVTIESMKWTGTTIEYTFYGFVTCLAKDLKIWDGEPDAVISGIYLNSCDYADEVELNLGDYEIEVRDGKTYAVKKNPKYPSTYLECCSILQINNSFSLTYNNIDNKYITSYEYQLMLDMDKLRKLKVCRDAYWKIAGEEMGLGKPWEPDLDNEELYCIQNYNKQIIKSKTNTAFNKILIFPPKD